MKNEEALNKAYRVFHGDEDDALLRLAILKERADYRAFRTPGATIIHRTRFITACPCHLPRAINRYLGWVNFTITSQSNRVGGGPYGPQPPTPPYVPFGIRRFMQDTQGVDALPEDS